MRKNLSSDLDKLNSKLLISDLKKNKNINNEYPKNITNENSDNSKLVDFQLPSILNHERNKNKNSDIIEFL